MTEVKQRQTLSVKQKTLYTVFGIAMAVVLPEIFHLLGKISGIGVATGEFFLPMHIPVLVVAMIAGPAVGGVVGLCAPCLSFLISGMPSSVMLPFMVVELVTYGVVGGLMQRTKFNSVVKLLVSQISGRVLRAAAIALAIYAFGFTKILPSAMYMNTVKGVFGIALQLVVIPMIMMSYNRKKQSEKN